MQPDLEFVEVAVLAINRHQLFMGARLHQLAVLENEYFIGVSHGRESVRDNKGCFILQFMGLVNYDNIPININLYNNVITDYLSYYLFNYLKPFLQKFDNLK